MGQVTRKPVELFCSYAHKDEELRNELEQHLSGLMRQGYVTAWHDRLILPGKNWEKEIDEHLETAHIIVLLISASFIASDYCYGIEMKRAMERYEAGEAHVIPILLRPAYWQDTPVSKLQVLPSKAIPVVSWNNRDEAFVDVVKGIRQVIMEPPPSINQRVAPVNVLYTFSPQAEAPPTVPEDSPDPWSKFGPTGEIIGLHVQNQQWGQAESAARQIVNARQCAQVLTLLIQQLAEAQQWGRAEAIAHSLTYPYHDNAHIALIKELTAAQQWERAEALTRSLTFVGNRTEMFSDLSRALRKAGHIERALRLANEAANEAAIPHTSQSALAPSYSDVQMQLPPLQSQLAPQRSFFSAGCLVTALIILVISAIVPLLINHTLAIIPVVWVIIGVIAIGGAIILFFLRRRRY